MKRRIRQNIYGNWKGYEGSRRVRDFGCGVGGKIDAEAWLAEAPAQPQQLLISFPSFVSTITGIESVRVGKRFAWITTSIARDEFRVARSRIRTPDAPSAFDLADIVHAERNFPRVKKVAA